MQWRKDAPMLGDTRKIRKFAWTPTALTDGWTVWLEAYQVTQRYETRDVPTKFFITVPRTQWFPVSTARLATTQ